MNRTDRLLAIVLELQAHRTRRAEDLAASFEISKRTVYRDIQALCEAGVPIVAEPGRGYSLVEGYFLPPLRFSTDEAIMLLLGSEAAARNFDAEYRTAAQDAARKIASVLPETIRDEVQSLQESIRFVGNDSFGSSETATRLQQLRRAIVGHWSVRFRYYTRHPDDDNVAPEIREADPYGLTFVNGAWYVSAHCHHRQALRLFRLERMDQLEVLDQHFQRPANFSNALHGEPRTLMVRALFRPSVARWVRESRMYFTTSEEETADGLLLTLHVRREEELLQWLLGWGANVRVLEPISLRERVKLAALEIAQQYS